MSRDRPLKPRFLNFVKIKPRLSLRNWLNLWCKQVSQETRITNKKHHLQHSFSRSNTLTTGSKKRSCGSSAKSRLVGSRNRSVRPSTLPLMRCHSSRERQTSCASASRNWRHTKKSLDISFNCWPTKTLMPMSAPRKRSSPCTTLR